MNNLELYLKEVSERAEKATNGPWKLCHHLQSIEKDKACPCGAPGTIWGGDGEHVICEMGISDPEGMGMVPPRYSRELEISNAHFISNARTDIHLLLEIVRIHNEALVSIASVHRQRHSEEEYWLKVKHEDCATVLATDTKISRNALQTINAKIEEVKR